MMDQKESENISDNLRWSIDMRMRTGKYNACFAPFGYQLVGGKLELILEQAPIIRYIYDAYLAGKTAEDMDKNNVVSAEIVRQITRMVVEELQKQQRLERSTPIGVSNRHVHLDRADMDALFGPGSELTVKKMLGQPGQYAAEETVTIRGPKGELSRVRVLGPLRAQTQVEISIADGFTLGVKPPVRESGQLKDTPGIEIIGPCGSVKKDSGVIAALRHVHMTPKDAARFGVEDGQYIQTEIDGLRGAILCNVLVRVSDKYALEMHIDVEEANALGVKNGDRAFFLDD